MFGAAVMPVQAGRVIWTKRRVVSVSATSVGSRSIELAP
jgi:hypothetical protein